MAKKSLKNQLVCIAGAFAAEVTFEGDYPAWEYKKDSKLREDMVRIFEEMYGKKPTVEAIHAGVECGLLSWQGLKDSTAYQWDRTCMISIRLRRGFPYPLQRGHMSIYSE